MQRFNIAAKRVKHIIISFVSKIKRSTHTHICARGMIRSACDRAKTAAQNRKKTTKNTRILFIREKATGNMDESLRRAMRATPTPANACRRRRRRRRRRERCDAKLPAAFFDFSSQLHPYNYIHPGDVFIINQNAGDSPAFDLLFFFFILLYNKPNRTNVERRLHGARCTLDVSAIDLHQSFAFWYSNLMHRKLIQFDYNFAAHANDGRQQRAECGFGALVMENFIYFISNLHSLICECERYRMSWRFGRSGRESRK